MTLGDTEFTAEQLAAIPAAFDSATNWPKCADMINDIRDQSNCGCCWAFGAAEAASDRLCISTNGALTIPLSTQELCFCSSADGCNGGDLNTPWNYIQRTGLVSGDGQGNGTYDADGFCSAFSLPHCHHHGPQGNDPYPDEGSAGCPTESSPKCPKACDSTSKAPHNVLASDKYTFTGKVSVFTNVAAIQTSIMTDGPVEAAFSVYAGVYLFVLLVCNTYYLISKAALCYANQLIKLVTGHNIGIIYFYYESGCYHYYIFPIYLYAYTMFLCSSLL